MNDCSSSTSDIARLGTALPRRTALLVLGMHRSGTSALTRVLNLLGATLPKNLLGAGPGNETGHWEPDRLIGLHDRMLAEAGSSWDDWRQLDLAASLEPTRLGQYKADICRVLEEEYGNASLIALKEPRICRFAPLYSELLAEQGYECLFVLPLRNPLAVIASLAKRNGMSEGFAALLWLRHVLDAEAATRGKPRALISYEALLAEWREKLRPLHDQLPLEHQRPLDEIEVDVAAFLSEKYRNFVASRRDLHLRGDIAAWIKDTYDALLWLEHEPEDQGAYEQLDRIRTEFDFACPIFGAAMFPELAARENGLKGELRRLEQDQSVTRTALAVRDAELEQARGEILTRDHAIAELETTLTAGETRIAELNAHGLSLEAKIASLRASLTAQDSLLSETQNALTRETEALRGEIGCLLAEKAHDANETATIRDESARLKTLDGAREIEIAQLRREMARLADNHDRAQLSVGLLQEQVDLTYASTSWRITAPLRIVKRLVIKIGETRSSLARRTWDRVRTLPIPPRLKNSLKRQLARGRHTRESLLNGRASEQQSAITTPSTSHISPPVARQDQSANVAYIKQILSLPAPTPGFSLEYVPKLKEKIDFSAAPLRIIAFYLPQFHPIAENDRWWGKGFTEWTNVSKAVPQYIGHYQPHLPGEIGFYDLRLVDVMRQQADLASEYGIGGFCFHHYWFGGKRLLEKPVEQFLATPEIDFPFCLCWANENWTRRWDGQDHEILMAQQHSPDDDVAFIDDIIPALRDRRYIRFEGRPVLLVYRVSLLPDAAATAARWRKRCIEAGVGNPYLVAARSFEVTDPRPYGFDAAVEFPPHQISASRLNDQLTIVNPAYRGNIYDYVELAANYARQTSSTYPLIKTVVPGWDNEARRPGAGHTFHGATPAAFANWLKRVYSNTVERSKTDPDQPPYIFINAWNEWAEGAHLEPDRKYGYAFLHAAANIARDHTPAHPDVTELVERSQREFTKRSDVAVVAHIYYEDMFDGLRSDLAAAGDPDLFLSIRSSIAPSDCRKILTEFPHARLHIFPNRGRDIQPFLSIHRTLQDYGYLFACKIHTKKSPHRSDGSEICARIFTSLLGSRSNVETIKERFRNDPRLGMIAPRASVLSLAEPDRNVLNRPWLDRLFKRLDFSDLVGTYKCDFVAGSMFWFRVSALANLNELDLCETDFEQELGQIDGTLAHAVERLFMVSVQRAGFAAKELD